jgi:hypothetical protein
MRQSSQGKPGAIAFEEGHFQSWKALHHTAINHVGTGEHVGERKGKRVEHREARNERRQRRLRQVNPAGLVEAHRDAELLTLFPEGIVVGIAPHPSVDVIGPHEHAAKTEFFDDPARFRYRRGDIMRSDDAGAVHARGGDLAEIEKPVVVGFGDGGGELRIEAIDRKHEQAAARIEDRDIESFFVHGAKLREIIETARFLFGIAIVQDALANRPQRWVGPRRRAWQNLPLHLDAEIALVAIETDGRALDEFFVDIGLPEIAGLHHVHVGIHRLESVFHNGAPRPVAVTFFA